MGTLNQQQAQDGSAQILWCRAVSHSPTDSRNNARSRDCAPTATCSMNVGSFTCACNQFYTDGSSASKSQPGRICYYSFSSGFYVGCLVMLPLIIGAFVAMFFWRRHKAKNAWINGAQDDSIKLVESQYPRYSL